MEIRIMIDCIKKYCCALLLIFLLAGCSSLVQPTTPTPDKKSVLTTLAPIQTATFIHPTSTTTVVSATITPHPTLAPSETADFIDKLASTDEICSFPCWGGIVPGKTNWSDVQSFLESFAKVIKHSPSSPNGYAVYIPLSKQYPTDLLWLSIYVDENKVIKYMNGLRYNLPINQLFDKYGKPEQIYLFILGVLPSDNIEQFEFVISYEKQGFFVAYSGETKNQSDLEICPSSINTNPYFWLWNPQDGEAMSTIVNGGSAYRFHDDWPKYQEISIATGCSVTTEWFYETYSDSANINTCVHVPSPSAKDFNTS